jgi:hypothetical protein
MFERIYSRTRAHRTWSGSTAVKSVMNQSPLLTDLRRLSQGRGSDVASDAFRVSQQDIIDYIESLNSPHEIWSTLITNNGQRTVCYFEAKI